MKGITFTFQSTLSNTTEMNVYLIYVNTNIHVILPYYNC